MVRLDFDARDFEPIDAFDPVPSGVYMAVITDSEQKRTRSKLGEYLQLAVEIVDGDQRGKVLWVRLNIKNPDANTQRFARQRFAGICRAAGVSNPEHTDELHFIPLTVHVGLKRKPSGEPFNVIYRFEPYPAQTHSPPHLKGRNAPLL